jgi:predicted lipoprotein
MEKMKKMIVIMTMLAAVSVIAFAGCQKETTPAQKPAERSSATSTVPPAKPAQGC